MHNELLVLKLRQPITMSHVLKKEDIYNNMKANMKEAADYIEKLEAIINMESNYG